MSIERRPKGEEQPIAEHDVGAKGITSEQGSRNLLWRAIKNIGGAFKPSRGVKMPQAPVGVSQDTSLAAARMTASELAEKIGSDGFTVHDAADSLYSSLRDRTSPIIFTQAEYSDATKKTLDGGLFGKSRHAKTAVEGLEKPDLFYGGWVMMLSRRNPPPDKLGGGARIHISLERPMEAAGHAANIADRLEKRGLSFTIKAPAHAETAGKRVDQIVIVAHDGGSESAAEEEVAGYMRRHPGAGSSTVLTPAVGMRSPEPGMAVIPKPNAEDVAVAKRRFSHHRGAREGLEPSAGEILAAKLLEEAIKKRK